MFCTEQLVQSMEYYITLTELMDFISPTHSAHYILQLHFMSLRFLKLDLQSN